MVNSVIKKDGTKIPFDSEKIKSAIMAAASEGGVSDEEAMSVASKVLGLVMDTWQDKEEVTTIEIKEKVLAELDVMAPAISEAWRHYDESKV